MENTNRGIRGDSLPMLSPLGLSNRKPLPLGMGYITPEQIDEWVKVVDDRLSGLYKGFDLAAAIDIMKALDGGASIKEAKNIIDNQDHSGMSYGVVRLIVKQFSPRGQEFWDATQM